MKSARFSKICLREIPSLAVSGMRILSVAFPFGAGFVKAFACSKARQTPLNVKLSADNSQKLGGTASIFYPSYLFRTGYFYKNNFTTYNERKQNERQTSKDQGRSSCGYILG